MIVSCSAQLLLSSLFLWSMVVLSLSLFSDLVTRDQLYLFILFLPPSPYTLLFCRFLPFLPPPTQFYLQSLDPTSGHASLSFVLDFFSRRPTVLGKHDERFHGLAILGSDWLRLQDPVEAPGSPPGKSTENPMHRP